MIESIREKLKTVYTKIKSIKHFHIYLVGAVAVLAVCIYLATIPKTNKTTQQEQIDNNRTEFSTSAEYVEYLENKLENVITSLKGVGQAEVVITLEKGFEYIYQTEEETRTTSNGTSVTSSSVVLVDGKPIMLKEIYPVVNGIVVIAEGSDEVGVRLDIISIIQTVIDVDTAQIKILEGKS